jgi:hypothetical protein
VLLHARSDARLADRLREIAEATGSERLRTYRADFSSLDDVRRLAERVLAEEELIGPRVRVLAISSKRFPDVVAYPEQGVAWVATRQGDREMRRGRGYRAFSTLADSNRRAAPLPER